MFIEFNVNKKQNTYCLDFVIDGFMFYSVADIKKRNLTVLGNEMLKDAIKKYKNSLK